MPACVTAPLPLPAAAHVENLAAVLFVFVHAYNRFGVEKSRFFPLP
ncbi:MULTISPECIES: hypothetical protein [Anaerotruncus]|jgi:hypothetical protein|nr:MULTISPECIES: hypothetical protein [Anaerotruncus]MCI8491696.1 hypothetical protein [Anaerotruncus sp.]MCR2025930.1 hypothetical protein [Anaerotruncus colihominis]